MYIVSGDLRGMNRRCTIVILKKKTPLADTAGMELTEISIKSISLNYMKSKKLLSATIDVLATYDETSRGW